MCENCAMCQFSYLGLLGNLYLPASNLQSDRWTTDETLACQYSPADTLKSYVVVVSAFDTWGINISKIAFLWAFHPILITWFLVVFVDEVAKILRNSLFIFHLILPILPCKGKTLYIKSWNLSDEKPKTKLPKCVMSRAIVNSYAGRIVGPF